MSRRLIYSITQHCTDQCAKCMVWSQPETDSERLPVEKFIACLKSVAGKTDEFIVTGGEPMLYANQLLMLARVSRDCGITMMFNTNAVLLHREFLEEYRALKHKIAISLDTVDRNKWESFRGRNHYDLVMRNIDMAVEIFTDTDLFFLFVLSQESAGEFESFTEFCKQKGKGYLIQPYMDWGGKWHPLANPPVSPQIKCTAWQNIVVSPHGWVRKCFEQYRLPEGEEILGNLHTETIEEIMAKPRTQRITEVMKDCNLFCRYLLCNN